MTTSIVEDLPLRVRAGLAKAWTHAVALDYAISCQPKDNIDERLWRIDLITEDLADTGYASLISLPEESQALLIYEAAASAMVCDSCLAELLLGAEPAEVEG